MTSQPSASRRSRRRWSRCRWRASRSCCQPSYSTSTCHFTYVRSPLAICTPCSSRIGGFGSGTGTPAAKSTHRTSDSRTESTRSRTRGAMRRALHTIEVRLKYVRAKVENDCVTVGHQPVADPQQLAIGQLRGDVHKRTVRTEDRYFSYELRAQEPLPPMHHEARAFHV